MIQSLGTQISSDRGSATIEFAFSISLFLFLAFGVVEYGSIFNERNAVTNLAREGASLASRQLTTQANMLDLLESTQGALDLPSKPNQYKIYLAVINGGPNAANPDPTCVVQERGGLANGDVVAPAQPTCDLPANLYDYLKYDPILGASAVNQFTVVKVYYQHQSITPVGGMSASLGGAAIGSNQVTMSSRAIF